MVRERLRGRLSRFTDDASIPYRVATAGCVVISVAAAVAQEAVTPGTGIAAIVLVPLGFVFSYHRRGKKNVLLKIGLAIGLLVAFGAFLNSVRSATSVDDTRTPLVAVFLWVQVLHSLDVPRARDLSFSVAASVVLIALSGSLAFSTGFLVFVLIHAAFFITALVLAYDSELKTVDGDLARQTDERTSDGVSRFVPVARRGGALALMTLACTIVVFLFLPRLPAQQVASLPFSLTRAAEIPGFEGDVSLPGGGSETGSQEAFDPDTYWGYGESMSLRVRGQLSEDLVMRVRSPRPTLFRGQAFDTYDDGRWSSSDSELEELQRGGLDSLHLPIPRLERAGRELTQTFYIERELPNIVFHALRADEIFIETTRVRVDDFGSIRTPFTLEEDTIYSVISDVPDFDRSELAISPPVDPADPRFARLLALPSSLSEEFRELSLRITASAATTSDKAEAVQAWLHANKKYRLDIPRDPPGRDPVDVFVFERDEGFCEQIAATMALMLRASGVPTRVVTGFGEGERNIFTGYWEVSNADAHAWVEVYYPGFGWIEYDPTFGVPESTAANTTFMLAPLTKVASLFSSGLFKDIREAVGGFADALPGPGWLGALVLAGAVAAGAWFAFGAARRRGARPPPISAVAEVWMELEDALARRGWHRPPHETAMEFAQRMAPLRGQLGADLPDLAMRFGAFRYGGADGDDLSAWDAEVRAAAETIRRGARA